MSVFLTPSLVHLEERRWDFVVLYLSLAHVLRLELRTSHSIWTEKLQTDVLSSHLATGRYRAVFGYLPALFLHLQVGEGTHSFVALVFLSAWGRSCSWGMLGGLPGWGRYFLKSGWAGNWVERFRVEGRHPCVPGLLLTPLRVCERKHKLIFIQTTPITPLVGVRYTHSSLRWQWARKLAMINERGRMMK